MDRIDRVMRDWQVDIEAQFYIKDAIKSEINDCAELLAEEKADKKFNEKKEDYQLEIIKQLQAENIRKDGLKITSATKLISDTFTVNGVELEATDFVPEPVTTAPLYEEKRLIRNDYSLEYQEYNNITGKRKFVGAWEPTAVLIVDPNEDRTCSAIIITLKGEKKPLIFHNGDICEKELRRQTTFARKGLNTCHKLVFESFLCAIRACPNKGFLKIPKHAGWNALQSGELTYISSEAVISGLEELFPLEVKAHNLPVHDLPLEDIAVLYRNALSGRQEEIAMTTVRIESIFLPLFEAEGLRPDRTCVLVYSSESEKEACVALTKRKSYSSRVTQALTDRITKVRNELQAANDTTVLLSYSGLIEDRHALENGLKEILMDLNRDNGIENTTRKVIAILTDSPACISEYFPAYYISCGDVNIKNTETLQRLSGMLDYSLIQYTQNNPDAVKQLVSKALKVSRKIVASFNNVDVTDSLIITIATAFVLKGLRIFTDSDFRSILGWLKSDATSKSTIPDMLCREFMKTVSNSILSGEIKVAKQMGPPYYNDDGHTVFIAETDKSINLDDEVIRKIIIPKISTRSVAKMNKYLKLKGFLKGKHSHKRKLKVAYDAGVLEDTEVFSYSRSVLNAEAKSYVDDVVNNEFWFNVGEYPDGFVPVLYNVDSTRAAGYVFKPDIDYNFNEGFFGYTRSGKTFAEINRAIQKIEFEGADAVIILDHTGGFSQAEIDNHIGQELRERYFSFWNVYENGIPVDLLDLRGCLTYKEKKERITRIYTIMSRSLGCYQEALLKYAVKRMLHEMKENPNISVFDILRCIVENTYNENGKTILDETHKKLIYKIYSVLDDLEDTPQSNNNWDEFLKEQGKPIVVISTGADNVDKDSGIIDVLLENLYSYKQCHPYEKYTVVLDEIQDLYLHEKGSVNVLLRKGGKHGITMILASQSFPDSNTQFGKVVGNCGRLRCYHPKADDLKRTADYYNCEKNDVDFLQQGECYDKGSFWSRYFGRNVNTVLKGKTVKFEPGPDDIYNNKKEETVKAALKYDQEVKNDGKEDNADNTVSKNMV